MPIGYPPFHTPVLTSFLEAGIEMGYPSIDYNGHESERVGFSQTQFTVKNGERWSTNRAYLHRAKKRSNLHVSLYSLVSKIIIDPSDSRAYAVEYRKNGKLMRVRAQREIILSAGAIGTPQILMLSGIGPRAHLESLGIPVIQDLPIGKNLMDHIAPVNLAFQVGFLHSFLVDKSIHIVSDISIDRCRCLSTSSCKNEPIS